MSHDYEPHEEHEEHEEHVNHEAWVIPFADLLTLLMAMFIALFAMSTVDNDKFKELSIGFNEALGGGKLETGVFAAQEGRDLVPGTGEGASGRDGGSSEGLASNNDGQSVIEKLLQQREDLQAAMAQERESLEDVRERIQAAADAKGLGDQLAFDLRDDGLHVTIITDQVLFDSGRAEIQPSGVAVLNIVAAVLADVGNPILIGGHTDNVPISTTQFPSNWELSGARASAVLRFVAEHGLAGANLQATGYADTRPVASNDTAAGRAQNRRVEIVVQSRVVDALLNANGLGEDSSSTGGATGSTGDSTGASVEDIVGDLADDA